MSRKPRASEGEFPSTPATPTKRTGVVPPRKNTADRIAAIAHHLPPAGPGTRGQNASASASDNSVTSRIERVSADTTPAPLPPSPAADAADVWFEQVPTNPAAVPDLDALSGLDKSGSMHPSLPIGRRHSTDFTTPRVEDRSRPQARPATSQSWLLPLLIAATCLTIGMILGALLFSNSDRGAAADARPCECPVETAK